LIRYESCTVSTLFSNILDTGFAQRSFSTASVFSDI